MMALEKFISELEDIRLRNLQGSRDILKHKSHWTDDKISAYFLRMHEDFVKLAFCVKRLMDPFSS